jgi:hypothetical protein
MTTIPAGARRLFLVCGVAAALLTAGAVSIPAFATNEYYECGACEAVNGKENWIKNNQAINHSGHGICAIDWRNNGGGNYTLMEYACAGGGGTATACIKGAEVFGHGEAATQEAGNWFLRGRQDNFAGCE